MSCSGFKNPMRDNSGFISSFVLFLFVCLLALTEWRVENLSRPRFWEPEKASVGAIMMEGNESWVLGERVPEFADWFEAEKGFHRKPRENLHQDVFGVAKLRRRCNCHFHLWWWWGKSDNAHYLITFPYSTLPGTQATLKMQNNWTGNFGKSSWQGESDIGTLS